MEAELDAVREKAEAEEDRDIRSSARSTTKAGLLVKKRKYELELKALNQPVKEEKAVALTPEERSEFFKMLLENEKDVVAYCSLILAQFTYLSQFNGLQRLKAAMTLARLFRPEKPDVEELVKVVHNLVKTAADAGVQRGREMADEALLSALLKALERRGSPSSSPAGAGSPGSGASKSPEMRMEISPPSGRVPKGGYLDLNITVHGGTLPVEVSIVDQPDWIETKWVNLKSSSPSPWTLSVVRLSMRPSAIPGTYWLTFKAKDAGMRTVAGTFTLNVV